MDKNKDKKVSTPVKSPSKQAKDVKTLRNKRGRLFKAGDDVELYYTAFRVRDPSPPMILGEPITHTQIDYFSEDKGWVILKHKLGGLWSWHVNDLEHV